MRRRPHGEEQQFLFGRPAFSAPLLPHLPHTLWVWPQRIIVVVPKRPPVGPERIVVQPTLRLCVRESLIQKIRLRCPHRVQLRAMPVPLAVPGVHLLIHRPGSDTVLQGGHVEWAGKGRIDGDREAGAAEGEDKRGHIGSGEEVDGGSNGLEETSEPGFVVGDGVFGFGKREEGGYEEDFGVGGGEGGLWCGR